MMTKNIGFTLIEVSIVLVVIGLIIGGVLVGRDLIGASKIRSQISQIEAYQTAVKTFSLKYNCLPGDCAEGASFGFIPRGIYPGEGDGNGIIEGIFLDSPANNGGEAQNQGETGSFWVDLSNAGLIGNKFFIYNENYLLSTIVTESSSPAIIDYLPRAKLDKNYVYVRSKGGKNYFNVSGVFELQGWAIYSDPGLTVSQASSIDIKIDDGLPLSGKLTTTYLAYNVLAFPVVVYSQGAGSFGPSTTAATAGSATTCYDNGNVGGVTQTYSLNQNGGIGINCALSFQFQ